MLKNNARLFKSYISLITALGQSMHYIQAWKIYSTKSAQDISLTAYIICVILLLHWLAYGLFIRDRVIILAETLGVIGALSVIIGTIIYS